MFDNLTKDDVAVLSKIVSVLCNWSGITEETPNDTEIVSDGVESVTLGDLRDASVVIESIVQRVGSK